MQNTQLTERKGVEGSRAICIVGMHRSGTSLVARVFNLLGVYLGKEENIIAPAPDNPEGFWENGRIVEIHEQILQVFGYDWHTTLPLPHEWWKFPKVKPFKEKLIGFIHEEFAGAKIWGWKDPRTCILLPLWREILSELNVDLSFVIVTRNPLEVADSLTKRNGFPAVKGWAIWFLYTVNALYWSQGYERAFLSYEDLMQDWQNEIHQAATKLSLPWPEDERSFVRQVDGFIKPQLRHHRRSRGEAFLLLPKPISQLYEICLEKGEDCERRYRLCTGKDERKPIAFKEDKYARVYADMFSVASTSLSSDYVPLAETDIPTESIPVKLIAFYLPQFHPIPENDKWWGRGFTEWTNVSKAVPQFVGHYQPHLPGELGFYDLRVPEVQRRQVELAKKYGIYGFCFYYYWFNGKRLLERPLQQFVADSEINFSFCLCWANENWTRRWDGRENEILIAQAHSEESDFAFIRDIEPYLRHRRYIRIHGRPLLIVYRVQLLSNPAATAKRWKEYCREVGIGDLYLVAAQTFGFSDPREVGFDAAVEFPPHNIRIPEINHTVELLNPNFTGSIFRYTDVVEWMSNRPRPPYQLFKTVFPSWDNEARRPGRGHIFAFSSPDAYKRWLTQACLFALQDPDPEKHIVFINAWNEWAEGAHLEPDRRYGYAYLQATADVLRSLATHEKKKIKPLGGKALSSPGSTALCGRWKILFVSHDAHAGGAQSVLLNIISWFKMHTFIECKILCLNGGKWLPRFRELGDTLILSELKGKISSEEALVKELQNFCGGTPDLIYGNSVASGEEYYLLNRLNAPIITHVHELEMSIKRYAAAWIGDVLRYSSHFVACSEAVKKNLIENYGVDPLKITTVYSSINPDVATQPVDYLEKRRRRNKLGLEENKHIVFGCGSGMAFRKGADLFIQVARILRRKGREDFHFYWIGSFDEKESGDRGSLWADHLAALRSDGLQEYVTFLGFKDKPKEYFQAGDIFLLASREDPFPLVALEAAECGLPIICFAVAGGIPEFVEEDAGFVVPFEDVECMAEKVATLMENENLRRRLGIRAREKLLSRFTAEKTVPCILSICRRVVEKKAADVKPAYRDSHVIKGIGKVGQMYLNARDMLHEIKERGTLSVALSLIRYVGRRPVFIWGAGSGGVRTLRSLERVGLRVEGFIDNDASKWGNRVMGLTVYSPARVKLTDTSGSLRPYIVIGSVYASEIAAQLKGLGLQEELDFCVSPLL